MEAEFQNSREKFSFIKDNPSATKQRESELDPSILSNLAKDSFFTLWQLSLQYIISLANRKHDSPQILTRELNQCLDEDSFAVVPRHLFHLSHYNLQTLHMANENWFQKLEKREEPCSLLSSSILDRSTSRHSTVWQSNSEKYTALLQLQDFNFIFWRLAILENPNTDRRKNFQPSNEVETRKWEVQLFQLTDFQNFGLYQADSSACWILHKYEDENANNQKKKSMYTVYVLPGRSFWRKRRLA